MLAARHTRLGWRIKMNQAIEEKNKELVLKAFDTLFNTLDAGPVGELSEH